jgi:hypothetical protein
MKKIALFTGALCAISSATAVAQQSRTVSQSVVTIPAFENRFGGIHQPVVALNTINRSSAFETRSFGTSPNPADRGVVSSPTAAAPRRGALDATTQNIPVFPGTTVFPMGAFGPGQIPVNTFPPNVGFGGNQQGVFMQQGAGGSTLTEVDPFRTTATPGPAVNAVPNPAAPVPTTPQLQPSTGTTIPVRESLPGPIQVNPGTPAPTQPQNQNQQPQLQQQQQQQSVPAGQPNR